MYMSNQSNIYPCVCTCKGIREKTLVWKEPHNEASMWAAAFLFSLALSPFYRSSANRQRCSIVQCRKLFQKLLMIFSIILSMRLI